MPMRKFKVIVNRRPAAWWFLKYRARIRYRLKRWMWRALETHYKPGGRGYLKSMEEALIMRL